MKGKISFVYDNPLKGLILDHPFNARTKFQSHS